MVIDVKNLLTTYDCKSAGTPNGLQIRRNAKRIANPPERQTDCKSAGTPNGCKSAGTPNGIKH